MLPTYRLASQQLSRMPKMSSSLFPVALCGKNPSLASHFVKLMNEGPEYEVTTVFHTTSSTTSELRSLLSPSTTTTTEPQSGLGSNASASTTIAPKAIIVGAGFSNAEVEIMRQNLADVAEAEKLAWFTPEKSQAQRPGQEGFMESVVGRAREALAAHRTGDGGVEAGVFGF